MEQLLLMTSCDSPEGIGASLRTDTEGQTDVRGCVSMGSMGLAEPINFEKRVLEPINFRERVEENLTSLRKFG